MIHFVDVRQHASYKRSDDWREEPSGTCGPDSDDFQGSVRAESVR